VQASVHINGEECCENQDWRHNDVIRITFDLDRNDSVCKSCSDLTKELNFDFK